MRDEDGADRGNGHAPDDQAQPGDGHAGQQVMRDVLDDRPDSGPAEVPDHRDIRDDQQK
jgi:hypothetical protein